MPKDQSFIPRCPGCGSAPAADDVDDICPKCHAYKFICNIVRHKATGVGGKVILQRIKDPEWVRIPPSQVEQPKLDHIDDILKRQRDRAKQQLREQQDDEARNHDQAALSGLWDAVRDFSSDDIDAANEWIALISALTVALDDRGLMGRLNEPPVGLGVWGGDEPDAYYLAAEIFRQSLIDHHKAADLLREAAKLSTWSRVNHWLRRELLEHVDGRWTEIHTRPDNNKTGEKYLESEAAKENQKSLLQTPEMQKALKQIGEQFIYTSLDFHGTTFA